MKRLKILILCLLVSICLFACSSTSGNSLLSITLDIGGTSYTLTAPKLPVTIETRYGSYMINNISVAKSDEYKTVYIYVDCEIIEAKDGVFYARPILYCSDNPADDMTCEHMRKNYPYSYGNDYIINAGKGDKFQRVYQGAFFIWDRNNCEDRPLNNTNISIIGFGDQFEQ